NVLFRGVRQAYLQLLKEAGSNIHIAGTGGDLIADLQPVYLGDFAKQRKYGQLWHTAIEAARGYHRAPATIMWETLRLARTWLPDALMSTASLLEQLDIDAGYKPPSGYVGWISPLGPSISMLTQSARESLSELARECAVQLTETQDPDADIGNQVALAM